MSRWILWSLEDGFQGRYTPKYFDSDRELFDWLAVSDLSISINDFFTEHKTFSLEETRKIIEKRLFRPKQAPPQPKWKPIPRYYGSDPPLPPDPVYEYKDILEHRTVEVDLSFLEAQGWEQYDRIEILGDAIQYCLRKRK